MNRDNLHVLIDRYEKNLDATMESVSHEQFKWEAVKIFRDVWYSSDAMERSFSDMFNQARKGCGWLIDNSRMNATSGVVKMAEQEPDTVKAIFLDLQSACVDPALKVRHDHMVDFGDRMEALRQKLFPRNWKYQHTFHDVSCYMAFFAPEQNYIYRANDAKEMAKYIGFEKPFGSGWNIDLTAYYEMCDLIVAALREHPSLLEKQQSFLNDACYMDSSLHLMAFDFIHCCQSYGYYHGLNCVVPATRKTQSAAKSAQARKAIEEKQLQIIKQIELLRDRLFEAESRLAEIEPISLVGTVVTTPSDGEGIVIEHYNINKVTVQLGEIQKSFGIHRKIPMRPKFDDDKDIVDILSDQFDLQKEIDSINKQIAYENTKLENL